MRRLPFRTHAKCTRTKPSILFLYPNLWKSNSEDKLGSLKITKQHNCCQQTSECVRELRTESTKNCVFIFCVDTLLQLMCDCRCHHHKLSANHHRSGALHHWLHRRRHGNRSNHRHRHCHIHCDQVRNILVTWNQAAQCTVRLLFTVT